VRFVDNIRSYMDILDWVAAESGPTAEREITAVDTAR